MSDKTRLFVGLDIPVSLKEKISALPELKLAFLSRAHPDDLHLTLRFIGDVEEERIGEIIEALSTMKRCQQFTLAVQGLGYFQKRDKGVLYATIEQNRKLSILEQTVTGQMNRLGLAEGGRAFSPHITIARLKDDRNFEDYRRKYESGLKASWKVEAFHLYRSVNKQVGEQRYSVIETFPLSPY